MGFDRMDAAYTFSREVWLMIHLAGFLALALSIVLLVGALMFWRQYRWDRNKMLWDLKEQKFQIEEHIRGVRHRARKAKKQAESMSEATEKKGGVNLHPSTPPPPPPSGQGGDVSDLGNIGRIL